MQYPTNMRRFVARSLAPLSVLLALTLVATLMDVRAAYGSSARPFDPNGFWNAALPASTPMDPNSATYAANIQAQITKYYGGATINTTSYTAPVYTVDASVAPTAVKYSNCQNKSWIDPNFLQQISNVPIPANAVASSGSDSEMIVWQPSSDTVWELWGAQKRTDGWYACWGGRLDQASTNQGIFTGGYGVSATGLSLLGGMMRIDELQQGSINHALDFALPEVRKGTYSWPAQRTDGTIDSPTALAEGQRFRLDPSINVDALNMSPMGKMMAKAIQKYGLVLRDRSGSVSFYAENPTPIINATGVNPYTALYGGKAEWAQMDNFPWSSLQALPLDYGKPSTLTSTTAAPATTTSTTVSPTTAPTSTTTTDATTATTVAPMTTSTALPTTTSTTIAPTTTSTTVKPATTTTTAQTTSAWNMTSVVSGTNVAGTFKAPTPTSGSLLFTVEIHNSADKRVGGTGVAQAVASGGTYVVNYTLPANLPPGTYAVHQGVSTTSWSTLFAWKMSSTFVVK